MTFWKFVDKTIDRLPGWPSERQWATFLLALLIAGLLNMAKINPALWGVELFKLILQASVITGALNMILAFHFAANKSDEQKTDNTRAAFDAIKATANAGAQPEKSDIELPAGETATVAAEPAEEAKP